MHIVGKVFVDLMVALFFIGLAGSAVVILISFVEDFRELFGSDEVSTEIARPPRPAVVPVGSPRVASR
jgi:hypothetical protein